ncbi:MAG: glycosyltransferase family A protein [Phycisphaerales bacterium]
MSVGDLAIGALTWLPAIGAAVSGLALAMTLVNLGCYRAPPAAGEAPDADGGADAGTDAGTDADAAPQLALCIPARNEERNIEAVVASALASRGVRVEVLVYDDQSTDATPRILERLCAADARVRRVPTRPLPEGWNGKQWGCQRMGEAARAPWLLFTDADVRFEPDCAARALAAAAQRRAALVSTVPQQETGTLLERLVVPLIHWMLFSWLPMPRMRATNDPATSAGCGQFLLVRRDAWAQVGGHAAFRDSMHDGIKLPRALRRAGHHTDLFDGTGLVRCRMYHGAAQTWRGFTKNAYEGLGSPAVLGVFTALEGLGILLPWIWLPIAVGVGGVPLVPKLLAAGAIAAQIVQRAVLAVRFHQPIEGVLLHPVSIGLLLAIQWRSWWLDRTGRRQWRGRTAGAPAEAAGVTPQESR